MNLLKLSEIQAGLDFHIEKEKGLEDHDLTEEKILAFKVELGELANEERTWKFWKENPQPRNEDIECHACDGRGYFETHHNMNVSQSIKEPCNYCERTGIQERNPLLMEYVDCLHFILSIGLDFEFINDDFNDNVFATKGINEGKTYKLDHTITKQFNAVFDDVYLFKRYFELGHFYSLVSEFLILGEMLNLDYEEIEKAYIEKNKINHERQLNGY